MTKTKLLKRLTINEHEAVMVYMDTDVDDDSVYIVNRQGILACKASQDKAAIPLINAGALVCVARQWPSGNYIMRPATAKGEHE